MAEKNDPQTDTGPDPVVPESSAHIRRFGCPECGNPRIDRASRPFVLNIIMCAVTGALSIVACILAFAFMVALAALPVTAAMAILGADRCRECGYRFDTSPRNHAGALLRPFPWRLHILNAALLFVMCVVVPQVLRRVAGAAETPDLMGDFGMVFAYGLFAWGSLAYHLIVYHVLRQR